MDIARPSMQSLSIPAPLAQEWEQWLARCADASLTLPELMERAGRLQAQGLLEAAAQLYEAWLAGGSSHPAGLRVVAFYNWGTVLGALQRHEAARDVYEQALALKPDFAQARLNLGHQQEHLGRIEEALAAWRAVADAGVEAVAASYSNAGFIGFPLLGAAFGPTSMVPASIASIITVCLLFAVALVVVEAGSAAKGSALSITAKVTLALGKNPIVIAPIAGGLMLASGWTLPAGIDRFLTLLASAASPAALVSLGLFLAGSPGKIAWPVVTPLVAAKLIGQPAATWLLGRYLLPLPPGDLAIAVILAALPTGTGPYMVADLYQRDGAIVANGVLLSTIVSIATVTVLLGVFA